MTIMLMSRHHRVYSQFCHVIVTAPFEGRCEAYTSLPAKALTACEKASDSEIPRHLSKYAQRS
jgi:hypothetical protein